MDIRNFFQKAGKAPTKPASSNADPQNTGKRSNKLNKSKTTSILKSKNSSLKSPASKSSAPASKGKAAKQHSASDCEDVEIIADSDEESPIKTASCKNGGKVQAGLIGKPGGLTQPAVAAKAAVAQQKTTIEEKAARSRAEETTDKNRAEEKFAKTKIEEKIAKTKIEEKFAKTKIEEKIVKTKKEEKFAKTKLEEKTEKSKVEESTAKNRAEEKTAKTKIEKKTSRVRGSVKHPARGTRGDVSNGDEELIEIEDDDDDFNDSVKNSRKQHRVKKDKRKKQAVESDSDCVEDTPRATKKVSSSRSEEDEVQVPKRSKRRRADSDEDVQPRQKGQRIFDSDSDAEDPLPKKKRGRRKKSDRISSIESDDEDPKPARKGSMDAFVVQVAPNSSSEPGARKRVEENKKKAVTADSFFGGGTVHRTEAPAPVPAKRKSVSAEIVDVEFHDDDDFTKTLEQLDQMQAKKPRKDVVPEKMEKKVEDEVSGKSLSSKLSMKMKAAESPSSSPPLKDRNSNCITESPAKSPALAKEVLPVSSLSKRHPPSPVKHDFAKAEIAMSRKSHAEHAPPSPVRNTQSKASSLSPVKNAQSKASLSPVKNAQSKPMSLSPVRNTPSMVSSAEKKTPKSEHKEDSGGKGSANRNWGAYRSFLNREGPRALGSKEIPVGAENCLEGLTFVITGVLESLERDEAKSLIERYGGKVTGNVSNRTSYLLLGRDPGASKISKAEQCKTKQIDEDGLLEMIRTLPGKKSKYQEQAEKAHSQEQTLKKAFGAKGSNHFTSLKKMESKPLPPPQVSSEVGRQLSEESFVEGGESLMWVDKHKPSSIKQIIGQQGDKSNAKKLLVWLQRWHKNRAAGVKPTGRFNAQDDGGGFRAALLSGPPGIGKTTTAVLVCKEAGFSVVELNASDKRSKRSLKEDVAEALNNQTMVDYMGGHSGPVTGQNHCLIMDEVDGMAGSEDRGGLQELVQLIKTTRIPIITICNDRNSLKMRTLAGYCFDLRFQRPRLEQIKGALMSVAFKEGLKISPPAMQEIILSSNQDIRQCIHNLSMWTANNKELTYDQAKADAKNAEKDIRLGIFDVARKIFAGGEETAKMTLNDKSDLFFQDYSFVPLFVHENYLSVMPYAARGDRNKHLSLLARAADSISEGDLVDKQVRGNGNWSLLPVQAMYASVIPGEHMRGAVSQMIQFPQWLGRNSTTTKNDRILQELRMHMALQITSDKRGLNMDYLPALRARLTDPLARLGSEGVPHVIQLMDDYDIIKDDYDNILDITKWPNSKDPLGSLDSKTKAAFTRQYNKESHLTPYATGLAVKKKRGKGGVGAAAEEDFEDLEREGEGGATGDGSESEEEGEMEADTMIVVKNGARKGSTSKSKGPTKGRGQGKGKGR